jgi:tRNA 2-thiouridine synthesizing protein A
MAKRVEVDATGLLCPLPVLRARKRLEAIAPGTEIALVATDPAALVDVPHFCAQAGHDLVSTCERADGATVYTIRRGG